jgi:hypothetical protein
VCASVFQRDIEVVVAHDRFFRSNLTVVTRSHEHLSSAALLVERIGESRLSVERSGKRRLQHLHTEFSVEGALAPRTTIPALPNPSSSIDFAHERIVRV